MKKTLTFFFSALMITAIFAEDYQAGADFKIENKLMFHGDANFSDFSVLGAQSVMAGMDFDGDGNSEILFTMDETLPPGGADPGNVGIYLYESDGVGGYNHVWHFVSPDPANSLPGMFHGDIDNDGSPEIYFGVPPALGSNDATWGTYIFELGTDGMFPATATHLLRYGMEAIDNFRPAGYAMADIDGDGKTELATVDRGGRRLSIDALTGDDLDDLASFTNEFMDVENLAGGGVYDVDIADTDRDGRPEVWVNTWDNFSFAIFEATGPNEYALAADLNGLFPDNDPGSFNRTGFAFKDVDMDNDHDAWFPMTNGKLYYFENPALDSISPNTLTQGNVDGGTSEWLLSDSVAVVMTGDTLYYETTIETLTAADGTDSLAYDTTLVTFAASDLDKALQVWGGSAHLSVPSPAAGSQFYASVHVLPGDAGYSYADGGDAVFFANFKDASGTMIDVMHNTDTLAVASTAGVSNTWTPLNLFLTVPANAVTLEVGVKHMHATTTATTLADGSVFVDVMEMSPVVGNGVADITAANFSEVLTFGGNSSRGGDMGDIDGDSKPDIIVGTGTNETVVWIEFVGNDPTDPADYMMTTILSSQGGALDRYYPLDISGTDLDGDGSNEVVISNLFSTETSQPQIIVLEHSSFSWDSEGGNEDSHLAPNWTVSAIGEKSINDSLFQSDPTGNSRTVIGGMDMDMDGKKEVIATDYVGGRVIVYEMDMTNNAFDVVWSSPVVEARNHVYNPRTVNVGDLDGDGKQEIVFPSSNVDAEGYHIYEWDGVEGSDNYGAQPSAICAVEVAICCGDDGAGFRGDHERLTIFDIDGDGRQELITAIRRGDPRGTLVVSLSPNDVLEHNSGGGLETWVTEFQTNSADHGGGSPYHALPADLNGDGNYEVVNHHWNAFNLYNFSATGPDTYTDPGEHYQPTYPSDEFSIWGGYAFDVDGDGNHEAYYADYGGSWGVNAGDIYVVDYDAGEDVATMGPDQVHRIGNAGNFSGDIGSGYDGNNNPYIFSSRGRPNVSALEYIGPDPSLGSSYLEKVIYYGELDVVEIKTTTDESGVTTEVHTQKWGFPSKVQTRWGDEMLDFDGDNKNEILMSFQNNPDSLTNTSYTWNTTNSQYDTVVTRVANPKAWTFAMLENGSDMLSTDDPISFIAPEDYRLEQNYPNPFNPNTMIQYTVPINRKISVKIYNVNGQLVNTLINNELVSAGAHEVMWHGNNHNGVKVSTGMYFYSLEWAGMKKVKRMTLLK
jgi:flagellar hook assembly protein FlgD